MAVPPSATRLVHCTLLCLILYHYTTAKSSFAQGLGTGNVNDCSCFNCFSSEM
ncbi:hypothetical protein M758_5G193800 [Ceratodon purpureus]|uniref:Uncharacterized protein n=1 Tax=Ceratodon purpureus TaxID=3225 RepID=A0A8T0I4Y6_CERPU|nr:hypothetical protein KC19_5G200800 [Ceratodon purpureus]KAG0617500.1 hypothetical protein M758_5G193800 [Ceratodon purpureus]